MTEMAEPIYLEEGKPFVFGRQDDCDVRISSRKASRRHAEIYWAGSQATLVDLKSNNGTYINEKKIDEHNLKDGDEIRIATYICVYRKVHSFSELEEEDLDSGGMTTAGTDSMFSGQLAKTPLVEVLTAIAREGDTGILSILPQKGEIGIQEGTPLWANSQGSQGEEAVLAMLKIERGMYVFTPKLEHKPRTIQRSFSQILSELIGKAIDVPDESSAAGSRPSRPSKAPARGPGQRSTTRRPSTQLIRPASSISQLSGQSSPPSRGPSQGPASKGPRRSPSEVMRRPTMRRRPSSEERQAMGSLGPPKPPRSAVTRSPSSRAASRPSAKLERPSQRRPTSARMPEARLHPEGASGQAGPPSPGPNNQGPGRGPQSPAPTRPRAGGPPPNKSVRRRGPRRQS